MLNGLYLQKILTDITGTIYWHHRSLRLLEKKSVNERTAATVK